MEALYREGILQPVAPPHRAQLLEGALRPHRGWIATYLSFWVQAYNTHLVRRTSCRGATRTCSIRAGKASSASKRACPTGIQRS